MAAGRKGTSRPPGPTIDQVIEEFLADQRGRLKRRTFTQHKDVLDLLRSHLNGYGYEGLSKAESALFDKYYDAEGEEHCEFCRLFGPDKIVENLGGFLGYFMIRKVIAGAELKRAAGTVTKKLSQWLVEKGYISEESAREGSERGGEAARDLPKADRATEILLEAAEKFAAAGKELDDKDYRDFGQYTIAKLEPGKLWLKDPERDETLGPVPVPKEATSLLEEGWELSCAMGRIRGQWQILEIANVYPM
ncbi:MAG: hypothetical protein HYY65_08405 [Candidatus Tectomicrobia bacterium]|uniref:Uncharacterized protein n=1 Tax=Tectimicrobiota bacterium TaxID=2528274 RepID=A0A932GQ16_UNCTE|nr:hypothetical protein [Candidatus Tectomicrobia bacterium]